MTEADRSEAAEAPDGARSRRRARMATRPSPRARDRASHAAKKQGTDWWGEIKAIFWLILAVLAFHSLIAKPFYIPSESMMPGLLVGDRLVVTQISLWLVLGHRPASTSCRIWQGRLWGAMPERGDVVIVTPPGASSDYIKRVIGLPGDTIEVIDGRGLSERPGRCRAQARPRR